MNRLFVLLLRANRFAPAATADASIYSAMSQAEPGNTPDNSNRCGNVFWAFLPKIGGLPC
jgi:hypothetical protein